MKKSGGSVMIAAGAMLALSLSSASDFRAVVPADIRASFLRLPAGLPTQEKTPFEIMGVYFTLAKGNLPEDGQLRGWYSGRLFYANTASAYPALLGGRDVEELHRGGPLFPRKVHRVAIFTDNAWDAAHYDKVNKEYLDKVGEELEKQSRFLTTPKREETGVTFSMPHRGASCEARKHQSYVIVECSETKDGKRSVRFYAYFFKKLPASQDDNNAPAPPTPNRRNAGDEGSSLHETPARSR